MSFGDLDQVIPTEMQNWSFGARSDTPAGKNEELFKRESVQEDVRLWIPEWEKWHNLYRTTPELAAPLDTLGLHICGLGWTSKKHEKILRNIRGNGSDIIDSIVMNTVMEYLICGDGFAEIIKRKDRTLINLKPLNPGFMRIKGNSKGIITKFEEVAVITGEDGVKRIEVLQDWDPDEIFHLSWGRLAMEIHGIPAAEKLENHIKKIGLARDTTSVIHRRHAVPAIVWEVDEHDKTKIENFKKDQDKMFKNMENLVVPKGSASYTVLQMQKGTIDEGINWIKNLNEEIVKGIGVPNIHMGSEIGQGSEAKAKIISLNFQPRANWHRIFLEAQFKAQLGIDIKFKEPPSIDPALLTDARKNTGDNVRDVDPTKSE